MAQGTNIQKVDAIISRSLGGLLDPKIVDRISREILRELGIEED